MCESGVLFLMFVLQKNNIDYVYCWGRQGCFRKRNMGP